MPNKRRRTSLQLKLELIDAVGKALTKYGHTHLGINNVSIEAGVEKPAIYRHFESFDDLLHAYIEKQDYWLSELKEFSQETVDDERDFAKRILIGQFRTLFKSKELQQLHIWELGDADDVVTSIALKREILAIKLLKQSEKVLENQGINFNCIMAVLIAGIYYLILHKDKSTFCNVDITAKADRDDFLKSIEWLIDLIFDSKESNTLREREKIAVKAYREGVEIDKIARFVDLSEKHIRELIN